MSLVFYGHPLSSFCWKVLIALYENEIPFTWKLVDLGDPASRAELAGIWPMAKMPVLVDDARRQVVAETSIVIDYLDLHYSGRTRFIPTDPDLGRATRFWDRVFDLHLQVPMQKIVGDRLRPEGRKDPFGVEEARRHLATALGMVEGQVAGKAWAVGDDFTMADCAAAPALFYADKVMPLAGAYPEALALLDRLKARPSFARVIEEAEPYFQYFPEE